MLTIDSGFGIASMLKLTSTEDDVETVNCPACQVIPLVPATGVSPRRRSDSAAGAQVLWINSASSLAIWPYGLLYSVTYGLRFLHDLRHP